MTQAKINGVLFVGFSWICLIGCIKAPAVVLLDNKTALEQQAAGEFPSLQNDLRQAGVQPKGEDLTGAQLEKQQTEVGGRTLGDLVRLYSVARTDRQWIDQMLMAHCIGESREGLLQQTPDRCKQQAVSVELTRVAERTNLHRRQLWRALAGQQAEASMDAVRRIWREKHLKRVVCGGLIQADSGAWEEKKCE